MDKVIDKIIDLQFDLKKHNLAGIRIDRDCLEVLMTEKVFDAFAEKVDCPIECIDTNVGVKNVIEINKVKFETFREIYHERL